MPLSPLTCPGPALNTETLWVPFDVLTTIAGRMWHRIKYVENDHIQNSGQYNPTKPAKYRLYVRWFYGFHLPYCRHWCGGGGYSGWCPDKEQSGAQHSAGAGPDKDTARAVLWRGRCSLASWRWALPTQHRHHPPAWSPGSGFSFHTPPFISLLDFYCTVSFVNLELQMQNCTKWEVKQTIIKSLYCVNCDWYGNETLTEVYILYCLCLCHILHLQKSLVVM